MTKLDKFSFPFSSLAYDTSSSSTSTSTSTTSTSATPFLLTDIGEGITEVEILQWFIEPNQTVSQFDRVCEVQSDKATVEITSRYDGIVQSLNGNVGDMVQVGDAIMYIQLQNDHESRNGIQTGSTDGSVNGMEEDYSWQQQQQQQISSSPHSSISIPLSTPSPSSPSNRSESINGKVFATPAVRKIAKEYNLNLSTIHGTGRDGRILKEDILKYIGLIGNGNDNFNDNTKNHNNNDSRRNNNVPLRHDHQSRPTPNNINPSSSIDHPRSSKTENNNNNNISTTPATVEQQNNDEEDTIIPMRGYHRLMVNSMTSTLQVPHMTYSDEVDMTSLIQCRAQLKHHLQSSSSSTQIQLSYLPFIIKATSLAMKEYKILNSTIDTKEMTLTYHTNHNIGIAMDSNKGLVVPVIQNCQGKSIMDITVELNRLRLLAEKCTLSDADLSNPTFTISNIGSIGGTIMSPIVLPPQVAIGAMGKIQRMPKFVNDTSLEVIEKHIMNISWGGDHRVVDGATMGRFSNLWKHYIENPMTMVFDMK